MPEWGELAGAFGPVMALVIYMVMNRPKPEAKAENPADELTKELRAQRDLLVRILALIERGNDK